jgi:hypothetical protein
MRDFRQFDAGPDPFGRSCRVLMKWMQTAIALRHSDTVDVRFIVECEGVRTEKTMALPHPALLDLAAKLNRKLTDPWCSRLAALRLVQMIATGEDMEKELVTVSPAQLAEVAAELEREEQDAVRGWRRGAS